MGVLTNGGLSINRRQLFNSVGELSSSELAERDGIFWIFAISQLRNAMTKRQNNTNKKVSIQLIFNPFLWNKHLRCIGICICEL